MNGTGTYEFVGFDRCREFSLAGVMPVSERLFAFPGSSLVLGRYFGLAGRYADIGSVFSLPAPKLSKSFFISVGSAFDRCKYRVRCFTERMFSVICGVCRRVTAAFASFLRHPVPSLPTSSFEHHSRTVLGWRL